MTLFGLGIGITLIGVGWLVYEFVVAPLRDDWAGK